MNQFVCWLGCVYWCALSTAANCGSERKAYTSVAKKAERMKKERWRDPAFKLRPPCCRGWVTSLIYLFTLFNSPLVMPNRTASVLDVFSASSSSAVPHCHPMMAGEKNKPFLYTGLDERAPCTAVKLKAQHHGPCSFLYGQKEEGAERSNYYLLCSCCFHGLFYVLIPGQILSTAVPTLSEENRKNSAAQQASAFCYYGYDSIIGSQHFTPAHWKRERNVLTTSLLMELEAKGVSGQRGNHQPLNVGSSCSNLDSQSTPQPPRCDFKMASLCSQRSCVVRQPEQAGFACLGTA